MNTDKLKGKTALVTGGSRGIGKAICKRLAFEGAYTLVHYATNTKEAETTLKEIRDAGGNGAIIRADFRKPRAVETLFRELDSRDDTGLDILVNNAGMGLIEEFEKTSEEQLDELLAINVKAPFLIAQHALERLRDAGRIVNLTSIVTRMAMPQVGAYSMTKGAIDVMTLFLAKKVGPRGITVNSVAPGIVNTDMNAESLANADARRYMESLSTFGRVGEPKDIADVVLFLVSEDGKWISGQRIEASGGSFLG